MNFLSIKNNLESRRIITDSDCWILKRNHVKYPCIKIDGINIQISRIVLKIYKNIEIKEQALHKCDNPRCWNPEHIFDGTQSDNIIDSYNKGRSKPSPQRTKTHCIRGHEFNEQNTYYYNWINKIKKVCKICSKKNLKERREFQRNVKLSKRNNTPTQGA